ncbi:cytochrome P450 89A2-like [Phalaenopsis equestris]|uniref:cytochrome P450 89A2-like n=1 Tax=Phalaenopsis equestris TaxID=78828 RepID=UPI0009E21BD9|nr:cytochrome P450 89A2-like [Phalaenopsis equestris]
MDSWLVLLFVSFTAAISLHFLTWKRKPLPPGPPAVPILGNLLWLRHSLTDIEQIIKHLHAKYGPIITLRIGSIFAIFISDHSLAHKALVQYGAAFSDRPPPLPASRFLSSNQHNITSAGYGPLWRLFRRNLTTEILHPSKLSLFAPGRAWVLALLLHDLKTKAQESSDGSVVAIESFQFAMFSLLVLMCFGEKLDERTIRDIEAVQTNLILYSRKLNVFSFAPRIAKYIFRRRWKTILDLRQKQKDTFVPLIRTRMERRDTEKNFIKEERFVLSYVDSLLDITLAEESRRRLTEDELVSLCSEFLIAGTDTTATALQWIMAELVKHKRVQGKLLEEIELAVERNGGGEIKEEDLESMPYLKAVVLEGLRRHPPAHFVLPHSAKEDIEFEGYVIPKNASINFLVAQMGWDEKVWEEPMEFRPERFMAGGDGEGVDITGSREIKMMPFGVGRRICPGLKLALLHLEYFVANLVRDFEWDVMDGEDIDLSEKPQLTVVMKNPLRARLSPRNRA